MLQGKRAYSGSGDEPSPPLGEPSSADADGVVGFDGFDGFDGVTDSGVLAVGPSTPPDASSSAGPQAVRARPDTRARTTTALRTVLMVMFPPIEKRWMR
ncbi:hypothetical protein [Streptomyces resistomycificus]|uniref:hypothetical protein n=1 Tax=Streptomyces resistomycificus TaxID=67356 RepID=UPI0013E3E1A4|nr:hypothetical protein [Streptomyces resistomycificus]